MTLLYQVYTLTYFLACVMNFITFERAYSLYPLETIDKSQSLVLVDNTDNTYQAMLKYADRGFEFISTAKGDEFRYQHVRWIEDKYSWIITLPDIGLSYSGM